jgi:hypothetical protein
VTSQGTRTLALVAALDPLAQDAGVASSEAAPCGGGRTPVAQAPVHVVELGRSYDQPVCELEENGSPVAKSLPGWRWEQGMGVRIVPGEEPVNGLTGFKTSVRARLKRSEVRGSYGERTT